MNSFFGWAFMKPIRKLYYNLTNTAVSVIVAVPIGGLETLDLIGDQLGSTDGGGFWGAIGVGKSSRGIEELTSASFGILDLRRGRRRRLFSFRCGGDV